MRRFHLLGLIAICLCAAGVVWAASSKVVTNPTPAVSATMELVSSTGNCFNWNVSGKLKPSYRGFGAIVKVVCRPFDLSSQQPTFTFGNCDGDFCDANVDACGNFSFIATRCDSSNDPSPQFDNSYVCTFLVHVDGAKAPQACNKAPVTDVFPPDPNGSAPCSGGFCPDSP